MTPLDSFIRRLTAQRDILNAIIDLVEEVEGPVLEFGLGNGRTYDHLRDVNGPEHYTHHVFKDYAHLDYWLGTDAERDV